VNSSRNTQKKQTKQNEIISHKKTIRSIWINICLTGGSSNWCTGGGLLNAHSNVSNTSGTITPGGTSTAGFTDSTAWAPNERTVIDSGTATFEFLKTIKKYYKVW